MSQKRIAALVAALQRDQRDRYEELVTAFVKSDPAVELWKALGATHGTSFNLFDRLLGWSVEGAYFVIHNLMPAVMHVPSLSLPDAVRFLKFADSTPMTYRHRAKEQLQVHLASSPELGRQLGESFRLGDVSGDGAMCVWADAFANVADPTALQQHGVGEGVLNVPAEPDELLRVMSLVLPGVESIERASWYQLRAAYIPLLAALHWRLQAPREMLVKHAMAVAALK